MGTPGGGIFKRRTLLKKNGYMNRQARFKVGAGKDLNRGKKRKRKTLMGRQKKTSE